MVAFPNSYRIPGIKDARVLPEDGAMVVYLDTDDVDPIYSHFPEGELIDYVTGLGYILVQDDNEAA